jgi:signal transduction histidine kinase
MRYILAALQRIVEVNSQLQGENRVASSQDQRDAWAREACYEAALVVDHTLRSLDVELRTAEVQLEVDMPPGVILRGGFWELHQALRQLLLRAIRRTGSGGEISLTVVEETQGVAFEIADEAATQTDAELDDDGAPMIAGRIHHDQLHQVRRDIASLDGNLVEQACPQGGSAVTLWLPRRVRRAVA